MEDILDLQLCREVNSTDVLIFLCTGESSSRLSKCVTTSRLGVGGRATWSVDSVDGMLPNLLAAWWVLESFLGDHSFDGRVFPGRSGGVRGREVSLEGRLLLACDSKVFDISGSGRRGRHVLD